MSDVKADNLPKIIIGERRSGKTTFIIKEASKTNGVIVSPTRKMAEYVLQMANELEYRIREPISYAELLIRQNFTATRNLYFDEYGMLLVNIVQRQLEKFESDNFKSIIIDRESIERLNNILRRLKVFDMSGKELAFYIEILEGAER